MPNKKQYSLFAYRQVRKNDKDILVSISEYVSRKGNAYFIIRETVIEGIHEPYFESGPLNLHKALELFKNKTCDLNSY